MKRLSFLLFMMFFLTKPTFSQRPKYLHIIIFASGGNETSINFEDDLPDLDDYVSDITNEFNFRQKENKTLLINESGPNKVYNTLANSYQMASDDDFYFIVLVGPWIKLDSNEYKLVTKKDTFLTEAYFLNFLDYLPSRNVLFFILEPGNYSLKNARLAKTEVDSVTSAGKIVIRIKSNVENNFDDLCGLFDDMFGDVEDALEEKNLKTVSNTNWLNEVKRFWQNKNIQIEISQLTSKPDFTIRIIK